MAAVVDGWKFYGHIAVYTYKEGVYDDYAEVIMDSNGSLSLKVTFESNMIPDGSSVAGQVPDWVLAKLYAHHGLCITESANE